MLTKRRLKRGVFRSVVDLQAAINRFLDEHNANSKPFLGQRSRQNHRRRQARAPSVRFDPLGRESTARIRFSAEGGVASDIGDIERRLWSIADQLRANSGLKPSEYSRPVLGLLFLRYADGRFAEVEKQLQPRPGSRLGAPTPDAFKARASFI